MKKLIYLLAPLMCAFSLSSCGGGNEPGPEPQPTKTYDVTFILEDKQYDKKTVKDGDKVTEPKTPTKPDDGHYHYVFDKWYTSDKYTSLFDFNEPVSSDLTIYGKYSKTALPHDVTFILDGEQYGDKVTVYEGNKVAKPADPTKDPDEYVYTFDKWYSDASYQTEYQFDSVVTCDLNLYGKFNKSPKTKAKVTFSSDHSIIKDKDGEFTEKEMLVNIPIDLSIVSDFKYAPVGKTQLTIKDKDGNPYDASLYSCVDGNLNITVKKDITITATSILDPYFNEPLCLTSLTDNNELGIVIANYSWGDISTEKEQINLDYSFDKITWTTLNLGDIPEKDSSSKIKIADLNKGDKVYLRGNNQEGFSYFKEYDVQGGEDIFYSFYSKEDNLFDLTGNIMSLLSAEDFTSLIAIPNEYCFQSLFARSLEMEDFIGVNLKNANRCYLPATELADSAYYNLFCDNETLESAPLYLPSTTVNNYAYEYMFVSCSSLKKTPIILGEKIGYDGMEYMFQNCTNLTEVSDFYFTEIGEYGACNMFWDCTSLQNVPLIPTADVILGECCYNHMFNSCSNLEIKEDGTGKLILDTYNIQESDLDKFDFIFDSTKGHTFYQIQINTKYYC